MKYFLFISGVLGVVSCFRLEDNIREGQENFDKFDESLLKELLLENVARGLEVRARSEMSPSERSAIVKQHNSLRRQEGAADMEMMTWNEELARKAQDLANTCIFDHAMLEWTGSPYDRVGQNLYIGTKRDIPGGVQSWYNEKRDYNYGSGCVPGKVCGHYTQIVWAKTREIGCAIHYCRRARAPLFGTTFENSHYLVCNYGPAGNMGDNLPYTRGRSCSKCSGQGMWCQNNLCSSERCTGYGCACQARCQNGGRLDRARCTCECPDGYYGSDCSELCEDKDPTCGYRNGWPPSWCDNVDTPYVAENCPKMCNKCTPAGGFQCKDSNAICNNGWDQRYCQYEIVAYECQKMCGLC